MNVPWEPIAESLRAEIAEYGGLLSLFETQQRSLLARNAGAVLETTGAIELQVRALHDCRARRESLVADCARSHGRPATATLRSLLELFEADSRPLLDALVNEVNHLVHRVRRLARHNHLMLARTVETQQELLRTLRPDAFVQTYTPAGRKSIRSGARPAAALHAAG